MGTILIIIIAVAGYYFFHAYSSRKTTMKTLQSQMSNQSQIISNNLEKQQIENKLNEIRNKHLENLINYEVTLLYQTELDDYEIEKKLEIKYPETLSRMSFNFTPLYQEFDAIVVDECLIKKLDLLGASSYKTELNQPSLRFEYFIQREAKEKARKLFDDFVKVN